MTAVALNDEALLKLEAMRMKFIEHVAPNGQIPDDPKVQSNLLKAIDGGTKTILALKKIDTEEKGNKATLGFQAQVAELLRNTMTNQQNLERQRLAEVPEVQPKPGEASVGTMEVRYAQMVGQAQTPV